MFCCLLALVGYHKETVCVRLFCQLVQIGAFAYQLSDDVQVAVCDSFTHRTLFNECTDDLAFSPLAASAQRSQPCQLLIATIGSRSTGLRGGASCREM